MQATRRLLLVRHGLPNYAGGKRGDEPPGPPLSYIGMRQIEQAIPVVVRAAPETIYASPLERALQSARLIAATLGLPVRVESDLKEWHRTEHLYQVNERSARWLHRWLAGGQRCAAVLGHASPLLSIIRTALYLPHYAWWRPGTRGAANNGQHVPGRQPPAAAPASGTRGAEPSGPAVRLRRPHFVLDTCDRFEFAMGSVFELLFTPDRVTARCLLEPQPRVVHAERGSRPVACFPRPGGVGRNREMQRPWFGRLIEGPPGAAGSLGGRDAASLR